MTRTSRSARRTSSRATVHCPTSSGSGRTRSCRSYGSAITAPTRTLSASSSRRSAGASRQMRIDLTAWSEQLEDLSAEVATALTESGLVDVRIAEPPERWRLITDSRVGVLTRSDCDIRVAPKLAIPRLMFLLGYAADPRGWRELGPLFDVEDDLFSAVAHGFALQAERALSHAPLRD